MKLASTIKLSLGIFSLFLILQSCRTAKPGTYSDTDISSNQRDDFHELNKNLLDALKKNNTRDLDGFLSKELIDDAHFKTRQEELISNHLKVGDAKLLAEYYVVNELKGKHDIKVNNKGINNYIINYEAETPEMYFAFFAAGNEVNKSLISLVYYKFDYGWKVNAMLIEPYTMNGKTAPELYKTAKEMYAKGYLIDAVNTIQLAETCLAPSQLWQYQNEAEIKEFYSKMAHEANRKYVFPQIVRGVPTEPRILSVYNETRPDGVFPMIYYQSKIKLADTTALKKENENIRKVIGKVIPGIDKDKKYILYCVYNKLPHLSESADRFVITEKLK